MRRFDLALLPATPWRNGAGLTREIDHGVVAPSAESVAGAWDWRLSVASLTEDGLFSVFPGTDRVAVLLEGAVQLDLATGPLAWEAVGDAHAFAGDMASTARLHGRNARFFNVMAKRANVAIQLVVRDGSFAWSAPAALRCCLLVLEGSFRVAGPDGEVLDAGQGLLCVGPREPVPVELLVPAGRIAAVQLHPRR